MIGPVKKEAERWLRYAQEDLAAAKQLLEHQEVVPRHAAWLAQQAVHPLRG